ncbi:ORF1 [Pitorquevirus ursid7]|uniref:Capsid protein n=1 Tax=Giant panda anellovirus TaxID=2016460 RepID=A0A220IGG8_9VIRU|nr:ORF1 [Giant panda anellovirus]ASH99079.1 ORF1 [Giant panda anellovirus]
MPYRRRRRWPWRRHFVRYRRWRKPRKYWKRAWRRYRSRRSKVRTVVQVQPRRRKLLVVTGWEILGVQGSQISYRVTPGDDAESHIDIVNVAPSNKMVTYLHKMVPAAPSNQCTDQWIATDQRPTYWDFVGGFGKAKFDLQSLILRNLLGMNRFSENIRGYTHIKFLRMKFQLVRGPTVDYLFRLQMHRAPFDLEDGLIHPAHFINMPFVTWVESVARSKCCKMKVLRRRAPTDLTGWYDIETFRNYELVTYQWTVFDPNNPLGKNPRITKNKTWWDDSWMREKKTKKRITLNRTIEWANRVKYDQAFVKTIAENAGADDTDEPKPPNETNWWEWIFGTNSDTKGKNTPFLPSILPSSQVNTLWFRYKFYFQLGGSGISRDLQDWPIRETYDNNAPCTGGECPYCIREGDLDDTGMLKEKAYERITRPPEHRKKKLVALLAKLIRERRKRKRVRWADQREEEEGTGPTHSDPKKFKIECIRNLATRLRF